MASPSRTPPPFSSPPGSEYLPKDAQAVRFFADLMRASDDPTDKENLRAFRNETKDFQAAINRFAMQKAREASERYNMPDREREREREKQQKLAEERKKAEGVADDDRGAASLQG
ncbi:MAG: hypothetical protein ASARMPREDX12_007026 [Alectoria sarmentosa]|nr:MAG: hypothetical protein ASARMPREDX12_007026 [Alectoria sarmentosa]